MLRYRKQVFLLLNFILLVACQANQSPTMPHESHTPNIYTQEKPVENTLESFPTTETPAMTTLLPEPSSVISSSTTIESSTPIPLAPPIKSPALIQISPRNAYLLRWETNNHIGFMVDRDRDFQTSCSTEIWNIYDVGEILADSSIESVFTNTVTSCSTFETPLPDWISSEIPENVIEQLISPDEKKLLIRVETDTISAPIFLGEKNTINTPDFSYLEGWLVDLHNHSIRPIFASEQVFRFRWSPNSRDIIAESWCYGDNLGGGLHIIDSHILSVKTITEIYRGNCEGGNERLVSPSGNHIIFENGNLADRNGRIVSQLCLEGEYDRSFGWSADGNHAYVSCFKYDTTDHPDSLREYNISTGEIKTIIDENILPIKAIRIAISPNRQRIAFVWGDSNFYNSEPYGVWLLELNLLQDSERR